MEEVNAGPQHIVNFILTDGQPPYLVSGTPDLKIGRETPSRRIGIWVGRFGGIIRRFE
jgi:hypothetical protein